MSNLRVQFASLPDREYVVAEIWNGNIQIAEVNREKGTLEIEIYQPILIPFDDLLACLNDIKDRY